MCFAASAAAQQRPDYGPDISVEMAKKIAAGGGVGVSGVTGDQDEQCAKAGLAAM